MEQPRRPGLTGPPAATPSSPALPHRLDATSSMLSGAACECNMVHPITSSSTRSTTFLLGQRRSYDDATATDGPSDSEGDQGVSRTCAQHDIIAMGIGYMQWPS